MKIIVLKATVEKMWVEDRIGFNKNRKCKWLQKLCLYVLNKLGATVPYFENKTRTIRIDIPNTFSAIHNLVNECLQQTNYYPAYIIIGYTNWKALQMDADSFNMMRFSVDYTIKTEFFKPQMFGTEVIVSPFMEGIIYLPKGTDLIKLNEKH